MTIYANTFLDIFHYFSDGVQMFTDAHQSLVSTSGANVLISDIFFLNEQLHNQDFRAVPPAEFANDPQNCWVIMLTREAYDVTSPESELIKHILESNKYGRVYFIAQHRWQCDSMLLAHPTMKIIGCYNDWECSSRMYAKNWPTKSVLHYEKRFAFINRRNDARRSKMFHAIYSIPNFKLNAFTSFSPNSYWISSGPQLADSQYMAAIIQSLNNAKIQKWFNKIDLPQLPLKYSSNDPVQYNFFNDSMFDLMNDTGISIVAESITYQIPQKLFTTEKTFRPIIAGQPFIINAQPGYLQYLRELGYRTFGDVWDESYDTIADFDRRLAKIRELVADLTAMTDRQFQRVLAATGPAVLHNRLNIEHRTSHSVVTAGLGDLLMSYCVSNYKNK